LSRNGPAATRHPANPVAVTARHDLQDLHMDTTYGGLAAKAASPWGAVVCLSLLTFVLIASEFMPVSLLTPIAADLAITEGQVGQAISVSGLFAVIASLFGNSLLSRLDRRTAVLLYTAVLVASGLAITFAPNYLVFMLGRALIGISIGGFWSLSTAILARIVPGPDLPRAIAMLQGGTAFASVIAAPLGSFSAGSSDGAALSSPWFRWASRRSSGNSWFCRGCPLRKARRSVGCSDCCEAAHSRSAWRRPRSPSWASSPSSPTCVRSLRA
jgi:hypothetical protein